MLELAERALTPHHYLTLTLADAEMSVEHVKGREMNFSEGSVGVSTHPRCEGFRGI